MAWERRTHSDVSYNLNRPESGCAEVEFVVLMVATLIGAT